MSVSVWGLRYHTVHPFFSVWLSRGPRDWPQARVSITCGHTETCIWGSPHGKYRDVIGGGRRLHACISQGLSLFAQGRARHMRAGLEGRILRDERARVGQDVGQEEIHIEVDGIAAEWVSERDGALLEALQHLRCHSAPRCAVRTARPRLVALPSTYSAWSTGNERPCTSGTYSTHKAGPRTVARTYSTEALGWTCQLSAARGTR